MPKLRFDKDALKGFFVLHVEKIVLLIVLLLFGVFVYTGYSLEGLPGDKTPEELAALSDRATQHIEQDSRPVIDGQYHPPKGLAGEAQESQRAINDSLYAPVIPYTPSMVQSGVPRSDPALHPPIEVEAVAVTGPLAERMQPGEEDPLVDEKNSEPKKKEAKKKPRRRRRAPAGLAEYGEEGYDMMSDLMEEEMEYDSGYDSDYGGMSMMSGMAGMSGMGGMTGGLTANASDFPGFRAGPGAIAKSTTIVAVKAVVPYKEQWTEYENQLADKMDYNPLRDVPKYLTFGVERAEVISGDPDEQLNWHPVGTTNTAIRRLQEAGWYGVASEIADPRYLRPLTPAGLGLTMPIPPLMLRELDKLALHSKVPRMAAALMAQPGAEEEEEATATEADLASDEPLGDTPGLVQPGAGGARRGMMPGGPGMMSGGPGMMSGGPGMMSGGPGMMSGGPGMMSGGPGMMPGMMSGMEGSEYGYDTYEEEEEYGYDSDYGEGDYGYGMMGGVRQQVARGPAVEYLLVRFFDFTAAPGKRYRYRVRVLLEDPNRPSDPRMDPRDRALSDEVKQRLTGDVATEEEKTNQRVWYRRTEWSEPSDVVAVELPTRTLAGQVESIREEPVGDTGLSVPTKEPSAKVMAIVWDPIRAVDVPGILDAYRGSYLNFTMNADVIHPVTFQYKMLENYAFDTNRLVLDFQGGETLPVTEKKTEDKSTARGLPPARPKEEEPELLLAPTEILFMDETGNLFIRNELDDLAAFQRLKVPEIEAAPGTTGYGTGYDEEGYEMMEGMEEMYRSGGGRGRR